MEIKSKFGTYKVATGNIYTKVGDIKHNKEEVILLIKEAISKKVSVLTFAELTLIGYTAQDLLFFNELNIKEEEAIKEILEYVDDSILVSIGVSFRHKNQLFNTSFLLFNHKVIGIVPKTYLPSNNEFYENRWFSSSKDASFDKVIFDNYEVPFGNNLLVHFDKMIIGVELCEDLWVIDSPSNHHCLAGANVILNLSASNDLVGKSKYRNNLIKVQSAKLLCSYIYSSSGMGESSQDLVYSGEQLIYNEGSLIASSKDKKGLLIGLIDIEKNINDRINSSQFKYGVSESRIYKDIYLDISLKEENLLIPDYSKTPFIPYNESTRSERCSEVFDLLKKGLMTRLLNIRCKKVVIGVSGGLDSTLTLLIALEVFKELNYDLKDIIAVTLPGFGSSKRTKSNGIELIKKLKVTSKTIDIKKMATLHLKELDHSLDNFDVTYENAQARIRTLNLMDLANKEGAIVLGTGDMSEAALGFCTYNADHMSMYNCNIGVPKTLVKELVRNYANLNKEARNVLLDIINTPYSPELLPISKNEVNNSQVTENIVGSYVLHDFFLYHLLRNKFTKEKIYRLACLTFNEYDESYIKNTIDIFFKRFVTSQFKRSCTPDGVKVGSIALSPRGDLRLASDLNYSIFND